MAKYRSGGKAKFEFCSNCNMAGAYAVGYEIKLKKLVIKYRCRYCKKEYEK